MSLPITNCTLQIERRKGQTQSYYTLVHFGRGLVNGLSDGPFVTEPWGPQEDETGYTSPNANYVILTDARQKNGQSYKPQPGDRITVSNSQTMNGIYRQAAEGTSHGAKITNIAYVKMPCIKRKTDDDDE